MSWSQNFRSIVNTHSRLWLVCLWLVLAVPSFGQKMDEPWNYSLLNGLPTTEVYELFTDSKGFIWFGSDQGVTRFDGQKFKTFTANDGLSSNVVLKCYEDRLGRIWFFHLGANPTYYFNNAIHQIQCDEPLIISAKSRFVETADSSVILGCYGGMLSIDKNGKGTLHKGVINDIHYFSVSNHKGRLLMFTGKKSVKGEYMLPDPKDYQIPSLDIPLYSITKASDSLFKMGVMNYNGLLRSSSFFQDLIFTDLVDLSDNSELFNAFEVKRVKDRLFVSLVDGFRIYRIVGRKIVLEHAVLEDVAICSSIFDAHGGLWLGSLSKGLFHFPYTLSTQITLVGKPVVYTKKNNQSIYLANEDGLVIERNGAKEQVHFNLKGKLQNQFIIKEIKPFKDHLVILSTRGSLVKVGDSVHRIFSSGSSYSCFYLEESEEMLISTSDGIRRLQTDLSFSSLEGEIDLYRVFNFDQYQGLVYAADLNGLYVIEHNRARPAFNGIFTGKRVNVVKRVHGLLIIGTEKDGAFVFDGKNLHHFDESNGLLNNSAEFVIQSDHNRFWIIGNQGPQLLEFQNGQLTEWGRVDLKTVLRSTDLYHATDYQGKLYLSTLFETYELEIDQLPALKQMQLYLTEVASGAVKLWRSDGQPYQLNQHQNNLSIELSAINFSKYNTEYFYRINEGEWLRTDDGQINMSSLSPGNYRFEAYAQSKFYQKSKVLTFSFTIEGSFFQSIWFYVVLTLLAIATITYFINKRMSIVHSRKKRLMKMELQALQSQMNPHFTFNTLNSIQNFILKNETRASLDYLSRFAQLMRMILDQSRLQVISIDDEIKFLSIYLSLEQLRMEQVFDFEFKVDPEIDSSQEGIPSMLLQPFVENSIWHGFGNIDYKGSLTIKLSKFSDHLECKVMDNGVGRAAASSRKRSAKGHKSKGSLISQERIRIFQDLYGEKIQLTIEDLDPSARTGTVVTIRLPLLKA